MNFRQGIDISNYTSPLTPGQLAYIRDNNLFVIIGLQDAAKARAFQEQLAGRELEYYVDRPGRNLTIPHAGARVWVDVEPGCFTNSLDVAQALTDIDMLGLRPGIYCNKVSYEPVFGVRTINADVPLWVADYRDPGDFSSFVPFNGWTRPLIWQYSSAGVAGINCDLNLMEVADVPTDPTPQQQQDALHELAYFIYRGWSLADLSADAKRWIAFAAGRVPA